MVSRRKKKLGPHNLLKFGSATVPVYRRDSGYWIRFVVSHYRLANASTNPFTTLGAANKEALRVARQLTDSAGVPLISGELPLRTPSSVRGKTPISTIL